MGGRSIGSANWRWKAEYLYVDLGSVTFNFNDANLGPVSIKTSVTDHVGRVEVNHRS